MHPTRSTAPFRRALVVAAVPALVLTAAACGDDDGGGDAASFCEDIEEFDQRFSSIDDPTNEDFGDALGAFRDLEPPAEIADDWQTMTEALEGLSDVDFSDPEALAEVDVSQAEQASERIDTYLSEECGVEL